MKALVKPLKLFAIAGLLGEVFLMMYVVMTAYAHPSKTVLININRYGEAFLDIFTLTIIILLGLFALYVEFKEESK